MTKQLLTLSLTLFCFSTFAQDYQWAKRMGGSDNDVGASIAVDGAGNVYTAGFFNGTADFDPGVGIVNLVSAGGDDIFISKLDAAGNFVWAKSMGGTGLERGFSIAIDGTGNVYTTGQFSGTADFDPGVGIVNLVSAGGDDIFISKLDAAGNFVWAKSMGGTVLDHGRSIAVDEFGNIYTTGKYNGITDFDPGVGVLNLISAGGDDIFISKLDAAGNFVWAKSMGGTGNDFGYSIAVDAAGNVYTTGWFPGTADFDPGAGTANLISAAANNIFISKLNAAGNFVWAKSMGGTEVGQGFSMAVDGTGNVYITGVFLGTGDFDPGAGTANLTSAGGNDIFISKLDAAGNFVWAKRMGGPGEDIGLSIALDGFGNINSTGYYNGTVDFDPGVGTVNLVSAGSFDIFVSKLDASGNFVWAKSMGGTGLELGISIAIDGAGNVYTTGQFSGTADFDPGAGTANLIPAGSFDIFVSKLGSAVLPVTLLSFEAAKNKNDAYLTWKTSTELNSNKFEIERSNDGLLFKYIGQVKATGNSNSITTYHFSDKNAAINFPGQTLYYRFKQFDIDGKYSVSPVRSVQFKQNLAGIQVYPNPANDIITIQAATAHVGLTYRITDQTGRQVLSGRLSNKTTTVNISQLAAGIYFVQAGKLSKEIVKIVKQDK